MSFWLQFLCHVAHALVASLVASLLRVEADGAVALAVADLVLESRAATRALGLPTHALS